MKEYPNLTLKCKDGEVLVNKEVLMKESSHFRKIFKEEANKDRKEVQIDTTKASMETIAQFLTQGERLFRKRSSPSPDEEAQKISLQHYVNLWIDAQTLGVEEMLAPLARAIHDLATTSPNLPLLLLQYVKEKQEPALGLLSTCIRLIRSEDFAASLVKDLERGIQGIKFEVVCCFLKDRYIRLSETEALKFLVKWYKAQNDVSKDQCVQLSGKIDLRLVDSKYINEVEEDNSTDCLLPHRQIFDAYKFKSMKEKEHGPCFRGRHHPRWMMSPGNDTYHVITLETKASAKKTIQACLADCSKIQKGDKVEWKVKFTGRKQGGKISAGISYSGKEFFDGGIVKEIDYGFFTDGEGNCSRFKSQEACDLTLPSNGSSVRLTFQVDLQGEEGNSGTFCVSMDDGEHWHNLHAGLLELLETKQGDDFPGFVPVVHLGPKIHNDRPITAKLEGFEELGGKVYSEYIEQPNNNSNNGSAEN